MQNEIIEAIAASIACNGPTGLQYAWHTEAARAAYAVAFPAAIEMAAKVADDMMKKHGSPVGDKYAEGVWDQGARIAYKIRALVKEIG